MELEIVTPFLLSLSKVIQQMCRKNIEYKTTIHKQMDYSSDDVIIVLGIMGDIEGSVILAFNKSIAIKIISMMVNFEVDEIDELGRSALCELGNMIAGNASIVFSMKDIYVNVTIPEFLNGDQIEDSDDVDILRIPVSVSQEEFYLDIVV
ncbi:MAG: chemotaxis protein CheX [Lachnospiraceae bacterium]|nr:chemotaxis protein CheX [Lachnospiraceae bacterium]